MSTTYQSAMPTGPIFTDDRHGRRPMTGGDRRRRSLLSGQDVNVGDGERIASLASGSILAMLGLARRDLTGLLIAGVGGSLIYRGATGHCMAYQALDIDTAGSRARSARSATRGMHVTQSLLVDKSPEELYSYWRNLENLPRIMTHIESVRVIDERRSHWVSRLTSLLGQKVEWDAEITDEQPNRRIAWRSLPGSIVDHRGSVEFVRAQGERGTAVRVVMDYVPPAGPIGKTAAKLFNKPLSREIREDLRNFKRTMEVGEVVSIEGQPQGSCLGTGKRSGEWSRR